jgi:hypothetical protein
VGVAFSILSSVEGFALLVIIHQQPTQIADSR